MPKGYHKDTGLPFIMPKQLGNKYGKKLKGIKRTDENRKNNSLALKKRWKEGTIKPHKQSEQIRKEMSERMLGKNNPMYGKKMNEKQLEALSLGRDGKKGVPRPKYRGENHPCWKGGITPIYKTARNTFKYRQWRDDVFHRDDFTCQKCLIKGDIIHAHHIKRFIKILEENNIKTLEMALSCEELWNINNGITLCKKCHNKEHAK